MPAAVTIPLRALPGFKAAAVAYGMAKIYGAPRWLERALERLMTSRMKVGR